MKILKFCNTLEVILIIILDIIKVIIIRMYQLLKGIVLLLLKFIELSYYDICDVIKTVKAGS